MRAAALRFLDLRTAGLASAPGTAAEAAYSCHLGFNSVQRADTQAKQATPAGDPCSDLVGSTLHVLQPLLICSCALVRTRETALAHAEHNQDAEA